MTPEELIRKLESEPLHLEFAQVIAVIDRHYHYVPTRFTNGLGEHRLVNEAGQNEGSCKVFSFAQIWGLSEAQTLACFGRFYRNDVLPHPEGENHPNIRRFISDGWEGIHFDGKALTPI